MINFTLTSNIYYISENGGQAVALTSDGASIDPSWGIVNAAVDVKDDIDTQPSSFELFQNYPNPFNPSTKIKYEIPDQARNDKTAVTLSGVEESNVTLKVYDILGREVATLVNSEQMPGSYSVVFNASGLTSGLYFYKLSSGGFISTKKMILIK